MDESILARVESQRVELETNIAKLRKGLRHWQTLEIEYEGLSEEFQGLPKNATREECMQTAKDFKPELIDEKELQSLFNDGTGRGKRPSRLVEILSKRVDYVARNVATIRKQLLDAEKKRNALLLAQDPDHQDEAALPLSEITEELDETGKVISGKVENPGKNAPNLLDVLRKAGVPDIEDGNGGNSRQEEPSNEIANTDGGEIDSKTASPLSSKATHKLVESHADKVSDDQDLNSDENILGPTNPDDTEEDAALRQEMLQYGLGEVGAIVAELDLADTGNLSYDEDDADDYLSDYDENEDLYTDESEDETGATKNPVISDRYKRQMETLSKKHGITDLKNLGPEPELPEGVKEQLDRPSAAEAARQAAIARHETTKGVVKIPDEDGKSPKEPKKKKKRVGFASELDIAEETPKPLAITPTEPAINPVGDTVIERSTSSSTEPLESAPPSSFSSTQPPSKTKISRFKAARSAAPPTPMFPPPIMDFPMPKPTPEGPAGRTISSTLVERPANRVSAPADPIDFDEELHRREVAVEYQKLRNRKIHEQGGYVKGGGEDHYGEDVVPEVVVDENSGKPRKVSRFKAARLQS